MEQRTIGSLSVSVAGYGTNNFGMRIDKEQSLAVMDAAFDAGITLFDTADGYGGGKAEEWLGEAIASKRQEVVVATKFGWRGGADRQAALDSVDGSLRRLGTDYIDLLYLHRPHAETAIDETVGVMGELVAAGKVREIGLSNVTASDITAFVEAADRLGVRRPACIEEQYHLLYRHPESELIPRCSELGMTLVPFFPLANGLLTGKYKAGEAPDSSTRLGWALARTQAAGLGAKPSRAAEAGTITQDPLLVAMDWHPHDKYRVDLDVVEGLRALGAQSGRTMVELALGWLAAQPLVPSVIAGATTPAQVAANAAASQCGLTADEVATLDRLTAPAD